MAHRLNGILLGAGLLAGSLFGTGQHGGALLTLAAAALLAACVRARLPLRFPVWR